MQGEQNIVLSVEHLKIAFQMPEGLILANDGISFHQAQGEWLGIMGASGCGKTVLAKAISGLLAGVPGIIEGKISFQGNDLLEGLSKYVRVDGSNGSIHDIKKDMRRWRKGRQANQKKYALNQFAYIFQNPPDGLNPYFKIRRHMKEAFRASGTIDNHIEEKSEELFLSLRLDSPKTLMNKYPHELSGGMVQRVVIAMALAQGASYIIADECTTSLDLTSTLNAIEALMRVRDERKCSILFITHDRALAEAYSDRILKMEKGSFVR